ncbi:MAG: NAD-dependent epimerase/dehydratase family protein [Planctomycetota bacterium]
MNVLVTGSAGFLGQGLVLPFRDHNHTLRLMDVRDHDAPDEVLVGDVGSQEDCRRAVAGMDAVVVAHMAPREPDAYATPEVCFDVNVKGTANLFFAAQEAGITRMVVISSTGAICDAGGPPWPRDLPLKSKGLYGLNKVCQEMIAEHFSRQFDMQVAVLRIGYVVDGDAMVDKYGRKISERAPADTDRRDIGEVARLALMSDTLTYDVFHVMSTREAMDEWDVRYTCDRLGWQPRYDFDRLPLGASFRKP